MMLPINPLNGQSGPYSTAFIVVAQHIKVTGSTIPYSNKYVKSLGIDPANPKGE